MKQLKVPVMMYSRKIFSLALEDISHLLKRPDNDQQALPNVCSY